MKRTGIIVDDAMIMRKRLSDILSPEFDIVGLAANGQEAINLYTRYKPDFITLDISMPEKDGISALREILNRFPDAKVVMVSAVGQRQIVLEALELGAQDFIIKPFDVDRVLKAITRMF